MTRKQIRNFSAEEKARIVLELLKEESTIAQLAAKYEITGKTAQN
jgi:putative transposase